MGYKQKSIFHRFFNSLNIYICISIASTMSIFLFFYFSGNLQKSNLIIDDITPVISKYKFQDGKENDCNNTAKELSLKLQKTASLVPMQLLCKLKEINAIAFIGSTASGKTVIVNAIRDKFEDISIPKRFITRKPRLNDDTTENSYVSHEEFKNLVKNGTIDLNWQRQMEGTRVESYGFAKASPNHLVVYSANNAFAKSVLKDRNDILIIGVYAPDDVRAERLAKRSPDMSTAERKFRLGESSDIIVPYSHILVKNYDQNEERALKEIVELVKLIQSTHFNKDRG